MTESEINTMYAEYKALDVESNTVIDAFTSKWGGRIAQHSRTGVDPNIQIKFVETENFCKSYFFLVKKSGGGGTTPPPSSITIPANTDLNTLVDVGFYFCPTAARAKTLINCPIEEQFTLEVFHHIGITQRIEVFDSTVHYERHRFGSNWRAWSSSTESIINTIFPVGVTIPRWMDSDTPATMWGGMWQNVSNQHKGNHVRVEDNIYGYGDTVTAKLPEISGYIGVPNANQSTNLDGAFKMLDLVGGAGLGYQRVSVPNSIIGSSDFKASRNSSVYVDGFNSVDVDAEIIQFWKRITL